MKPFSLDHLSETEFEQFCFDLLGELGFLNRQWRKGTGLSTSPADRGRDIQCQLEREDIDGSKDIETWFFECKHSKQGVSPDKIQGALSWANSLRPDKLVIIASNFLSNPTLDYIEDFQRNNKPYFKIKKWQKPDLEKLVIGKSELLIKYKISDDFVFLPIMHPAHLFYIKESPLNSLSYFLEVAEKLDKNKRDVLFSGIYEIIIKPRYKKAVTGKEKLIDLKIDEVTFEVFKKRVRDWAEVLDERFLVFSIVSWIAQSSFRRGNIAEIDKTLNKFESELQFVQNIRKAYKGDPEGDFIGLECFLRERTKEESKKSYPMESVEDAIDRAIEMIQKESWNIPKMLRDIIQITNISVSK